MMNRRKFLKMLGVGAAALPAISIAAKLPQKSDLKWKFISISNPKDGGFFMLEPIATEIEELSVYGSKASLVSKLLKVPGVKKVEIKEDLISHSIECTVEGGRALDIGLCIAFYKPVAVRTIGDIEHDVRTLRTIVRFSRF